MSESVEQFLTALFTFETKRNHLLTVDAVSAPRLRPGPGLLQSSSQLARLPVSLAFEAAVTGGQVLLVDADTYDGAVAHANIRQRHRKLLKPASRYLPRPVPPCPLWGEWFPRR